MRPERVSERRSLCSTSSPPPSGLSAARHRLIRAGQDGIPGNVVDNTYRFFGDALAAADFDGGGHADLAIGAREEDEPSIPDAGAVIVLYSGALFSDRFDSGDTERWPSTAP